MRKPKMVAHDFNNTQEAEADGSESSKPARFTQ